MAIQKVVLNDEEIYISDELDEKETDKIIDNKANIETTIVIDPIDNKELNDKTSLDIFGGKDE